MDVIESKFLFKINNYNLSIFRFIKSAEIFETSLLQTPHCITLNNMAKFMSFHYFHGSAPPLLKKVNILVTVVFENIRFGLHENKR